MGERSIFWVRDADQIEMVHYCHRTHSLRNTRLGLHSGLAAMNVAPSQFDPTITCALADHCHKINPRIASAEDYCTLLQQAL